MVSRLAGQGAAACRLAHASQGCLFSRASSKLPSYLATSLSHPPFFVQTYASSRCSPSSWSPHNTASLQPNFSSFPYPSPRHRERYILSKKSFHHHSHAAVPAPMVGATSATPVANGVGISTSTLVTDPPLSGSTVIEHNVIDILRERGLVEAITSEELREAAGKQRLKVYCGFDPTAESLHLGNLLAIIVLSWFQRCGHTSVALVGGATGRVGDPSGKSVERQVLDEETLARNERGVQATLERLLGGQRRVGGAGDALRGGTLEEAQTSLRRGENARHDVRAGSDVGSSASIGDGTEEAGEPGDGAMVREIGGASSSEVGGQQGAPGSERGVDGVQQGAGGRGVEILNNYEWFQSMGFLEFLREVGRNARVGTMLAKESVKARLDSEDGMSFTEFCYQLLQGYDFVHLMRTHGVTVQIGGSDQWGNIIAGTELVRRLTRKEGVYGLTFPLLLQADGRKFGKSEGGAIWLSPSFLSPYKFYQHLFGTADTDVVRFMRRLTFMDLPEIEQYEAAMKQPGYEPNTAQRRLAEEVTRFVHGEEGLQQALQATLGLAPGSATRLDLPTLQAIAEDVPSTSLARADVEGRSIVEVMVAAKVQPSKGAARRLVKNGGAYLNNEKVEAEERVVAAEDLVGGQMLLLAAGKKNKMIVKVEG